MAKVSQPNIAEPLQVLAVPIDSIKPDPRNARRHSQPNLDVIKRSLQTYGQRKPIVVNKRTMTIEAGSGLWQAAKALGWQEIAAVFVDDDGETAKAFGVMDNRSAELAEWNLPNLQALISELDGVGFDTEATGFTDAELAALDFTTPELREHTLEIRPRPMLRVLISVPVDQAAKLQEAIAVIVAIPDIEIDYGAND